MITGNSLSGDKRYIMKFLIKKLYQIFLMPYVERERYFEELVEDIFENELSKINGESPFDQQHGGLLI